MDYENKSIELHKKHQGKIEVVSVINVNNKDDLSVAYTPGVAEPCRQIAKNPELVNELTIKGRTVAVVTDGSAVLGLGNIGPEAALPVMEGKALLFKEMAGVDAFPICLGTQVSEEIIETIKRLEPTFGGINLEDISAPRCFEIEERLRQELAIPVFHDDQHGTAIIVLAGLINALKVTGRQIENIKVVISGAGAAGIAIANIFLRAGVKDIIMLDSRGILEIGRDGMNKYKDNIAKMCNPRGIKGDLTQAIVGADVFVGVSQPNIVSPKMIQSMADENIIFALSNPTPEVTRQIAEKNGTKVYASGRSDDPNQINNVLVFPGIFKGALKARLNDFTMELKVKVAEAIAEMVDMPSEEYIIPSALNKKVADIVSTTVVKYAKKTK